MPGCRVLQDVFWRRRVGNQSIMRERSISDRVVNSRTGWLLYKNKSFYAPDFAGLHNLATAVLPSLAVSSAKTPYTYLQLLSCQPVEAGR